MSTAAPLTDPICTNNVPLPTPEQLPNDLETLKRMLIEMMVTLQQERRDKEQLQQRMRLLLQRLYGPRNERYHPDQGFLFAEAAGTAAAAAPPSEDSQGKSRQRRRGKPHGRGKPPADL